MAEHPILFSAAMVKAILEGRKTQTRRLCKLNPAYVERWKDEPKERWAVECPYGQPGDELWVRETAWYDRKPLTSIGNLNRCFFADGWVRFESGLNSEIPGKVDDNSARLDGNETLCKRSPIHMPRWASRIQLVIRDVRVQRLQEISDADAESEGVQIDSLAAAIYRARGGPPPAPKLGAVPRGAFQMAFERGWNTINGTRAPWSSNPWVWAITFERKA